MTPPSHLSWKALEKVETSRNCYQGSPPISPTFTRSWSHEASSCCSIDSHRNLDCEPYPKGLCRSTSDLRLAHVRMQQINAVCDFDDSSLICQEISIAYLVHACSCARLQCNEDMPYQSNCRCRPTWIRSSLTNSTIVSSWNWDLAQCDAYSLSMWVWRVPL